MSEIKITETNFSSEVIGAQKPVLLDFWAEWCGPCQMLAPTIEEIANENDSISVGKVNVDEEPRLATEFGITSIPTLVLLKNGKALRTVVGYRTKAEIEEFIKQ